MLIALLVAQYPVTAVVLAARHRGHHLLTAWFAVPFYDLAACALLGYDQCAPLLHRK
jgi:hypothetical protein